MNFLTTQEVVRRRYSRLLKEQKPLPDLILMDGGKVQMRAAMEVLEDELGLSIPIAGMVRMRSIRPLICYMEKIMNKSN